MPKPSNQHQKNSSVWRNVTFAAFLIPTIISIIALIDSHAATEAAKTSSETAIAQLQLEETPVFSFSCNSGPDLNRDSPYVRRI